MGDMAEMSDAVQRLTARLGIAPVAARVSVEEAVERVLFERGLEATVASLRWGVLELHCDAVNARLLRFDNDVVLSAVRAIAPDITELKVRVMARVIGRNAPEAG
jgi:hypothetical protein